MSKIKIARDEFHRVKSVIRNDGVRILYYKNKDGFSGSPRSSAYTYSLEDPPLIVIRKGRGITYRDLIDTLLHEYAHVLDDRRYGQCRRSKLCAGHSLDSTQNRIKKYSNEVKYAILKTELIAENMVRVLWKRLEIKIPFDAKTWKREKAVTLRIVKFWLSNGGPPPKNARDTWRKEWDKSPWDGNEAYIKDLSGV